MYSVALLDSDSCIAAWPLWAHIWCDCALLPCRTAPTELLMKQLAIIGSTLLVVVLSVRYDHQQMPEAVSLCSK